jgi:very-short-patch-repair endonuclease
VGKIHYNPKLKDLAKNLRNNSTRAEIILWNHLKGKKLKGYDFHRQKPIENFIVDFFCNKLILAIELDGYTHGFEEVLVKDEIKEKRLTDLGVTVLRFTDRDVIDNIESVLKSIEDSIDKIAIRLHTP